MSFLKDEKILRTDKGYRHSISCQLQSRIGWRWYCWFALPSEPSPRRFAASDRGNMLGSRGKAEDGHIVVQALITPGLYEIGLMPDAHAPVRANLLIKATPCPEMRITFAPRKLLQIVKRPPVLNHAYASRIEEKLRSKHAYAWMPVEEEQHGSHCHSRWNPFPEREETIDTHSDQKHNKGFICLCRIASWNDFRHAHISLITRGISSLLLKGSRNRHMRILLHTCWLPLPFWLFSLVESNALTQHRNLVQVFPRRINIEATKVSKGRRGLVNGTAQV